MIPLRNLKRFFQKTSKQPIYAFGVFRKRLKAGFYYNYRPKKCPPPEAITLFLTHRCNLHCKMCGQWGEGGVTKRLPPGVIKEELSVATLKGFIDGVRIFKPNITLFGGEPLLYPGCLEIIRHIKQKALHCLMITNGSPLEGLAQEVVESGLDELNVSLDGPANLHDEIRGMPGLFERIANGLKQIHNLKIRQNRKKPLVNLQCTITPYNYNYLEQMIGVCNDIHADSLTFHHLIFLGKELLRQQKEFDALLSCSSAAWEGFLSMPDIDPKTLYEKIQLISSKKYPFNVDFYPNFSFAELTSYYKNTESLPARISGSCKSPWIAAYIFPDGEVRPCLNSDFSFGNIKEGSFLDIWNSQQAIRFRRELKKNKIFPACARCTELYRY